MATETAADSLSVSDMGIVIEGCHETYVGGECLTSGEAFLRHPILMAARVVSYSVPLSVAVAVVVIVAAALAYRRRKKKRAGKMPMHGS